MIGVVSTSTPPALPDFRARPLQHGLVGGVLPLHEVFNDLEQPLTLLLLLLLRWKEIRERRWVVHHLREDNGARCGQRSPRPPEVKRARVTVADRLLPCGGFVDGLERQRNFDQLFPVSHLAPR